MNEPVLVAILLAVIGVVAFKIDYKSWSDNRNEIRKNKLFDVCTHLTIYPGDDGKLVFESLMTGLPEYRMFCKVCTGQVFGPDMIAGHEQWFKKECEYYMRNPKEYRKRWRKMIRLQKKIRWKGTKLG